MTHADRQAWMIDSDMATDDYLAILLMLSDPGIHVLALTVAATGEAHAGPGVDAALRLATLTGQPHLPVAAGRDRPLHGTNAFPALLRWLVDRRFGIALPRPHGHPADCDAVTLLARTLQSSQSPVSILALGPLTNIAQLLQQQPELHGLIKQIAIMGGAVRVAGNIRSLALRSPNTTAEWNIFADPLAADLVLRSGISVTLFPLDATEQFQITPALIAQIAQHHTPVAQATNRILQRMHTLQRLRPYYVWDAIAALLSITPAAGQYEELQLRVETAAGAEQGRIHVVPDGSRVRVCVGLTDHAVAQAFVAGLTR